VQVLTAVDHERIVDLRARGEFFWLDLVAPDAATIKDAGETFGIHPLAVEDTLHFGQRPKLDDYGDYAFLVFYGAREHAETERSPVREVHFYISGQFLITIHRDPLPALEDERLRIDGRAMHSEQFVVYRVLDALTDTFFPIMEDVDDEIDALEEAIVRRPTDAQLGRLQELKHQLVMLRRIVTPQRDIFARAIDDIAALPGLEAGSRDYFRDVYDHLIRVSDLVDSFRDLLSGTMDVYLSTVSNRLNVIMERLTVVATIFLPLTVVTGFFGMNFGWLVDHIGSAAEFFILGVGGCLVAGFGIWWWIRRRALPEAPE
jgi:magnesium transporter